MNRRRFRVTVRLRGPVVIGREVDVQNVRQTQDVLPGSLWRGTLGRLVGETLGGPGHSSFQELFKGDGSIRFGTLFPARWEPSSEGPEPDAFVAPLTAVECKASPGFRGHGIWDILTGILEGDLPGDRPLRCPECGGRLDKVRRFLYRDGGGRYQDVSVPKKFFVRVGLNRWTETAEEGVLYVLEAIWPREPSLGFVGTWVMTDPQREVLERCLKPYQVAHAPRRYRLRVGSARARGMGEVEIEWREDSTDLEESIRRRLDAWNARVHAESFCVWTLDVQTPLHLLDRWGHPLCRPDPELLLEALRFYCPDLPESTELDCKATLVEDVSVGGWSQLWGLPKPWASMIGPGSVLTFRCARTDRDRLIPVLARIEAEGLGERRPEGFGQVIVCNPFHGDRSFPFPSRGGGT